MSGKCDVCADGQGNKHCCGQMPFCVKKSMIYVIKRSEYKIRVALRPVLHKV
jgi:hypothetical protein